MNSKIAVYPGSFDPYTNGHADIVEEALAISDRLIIAVAFDNVKTSLFSLEERKEIIKQEIAKYNKSNKLVSVEIFEGLLVNFVKSKNAAIIVRGLRAISDFEYEFQMAGMNRYLLPDVETLFLTPSDQYQFISGTFVREIASMGGDVSKFVFPSVEKWLVKKIEANKSKE